MNLRPLGYEQCDVRLSRLARSRPTWLTSANPGGSSPQTHPVSPGSASFAASRLQIRLRTGPLTCGYWVSPVLLVAATPWPEASGQGLRSDPRSGPVLTGRLRTRSWEARRAHPAWKAPGTGASENAGRRRVRASTSDREPLQITVRSGSQRARSRPFPA